MLVHLINEKDIAFATLENPHQRILFSNQSFMVSKTQSNGGAI